SGYTGAHVSRRGCSSSGPARLPGPAGSRTVAAWKPITLETAKKLTDLATTSGRAPEEIVEDALAAYLDEAASLRKTLDSRYDDLKSARVKPIDGEEAFRRLREKSERRRTDG